MSEDSTTSVSRRTLAKGAAWSVPVIAVGAAAPAAASSTGCTDCVIPMFSVSATTATKGFSGTGTVSIASGFTFNVTGCQGLFSATSAVITKATLTWTSPSQGTKTYTASTNIGFGLGVSGQVVTAAAVQFTGITNMTNGVYVGIGGIGSYPSYPSQLCFTVTYPLTIGGQVNETCQQDICFTPTFASAQLGFMPGVVAFATSWT